jgi:hypothetical protein
MSRPMSAIFAADVSPETCSTMNAWRSERRGSVVAWRWFGWKPPRQLSRQRGNSHDALEIGP